MRGIIWNPPKPGPSDKCCPVSDMLTVIGVVFVAVPAIVGAALAGTGFGVYKLVEAIAS